MKTAICHILIALLLVIQLQAEERLPGENGKTPAVSYNYFPAPQYAFVFRNWTLVPVEQLAKVLGTSVENVNELAFSMGLHKQRKIEPQWQTSKGYIPVIRSNWNLLNYNQLLILLGITRTELAWRLKEDDFLYVKLGSLKPVCPQLIYERPNKEMREKAARIAKWVNEISAATFAPETPRFSFLNDFPKVVPNEDISVNQRLSTPENDPGFDIRMVSSYCAEFGDPLMDNDLGSFPEGLLNKLSAVGVNALWLHTVLNTLVVPDGPFPGTHDAQKRMEGLLKLVKRAAKFGIKIYLYMNEPRAMEQSYYLSSKERLAFKGINESEYSSMCTSVPEVREWLTSSLKKVFTDVPGLGGIFTITGSENLTSCISHQRQTDCERCSKRSYSDMMIEHITAMTNGVKAGNPDANVIVWDWGWNDNYAEAIIKGIPKSCWLMSVSEWSLPIVRGNINSVVGEYSISSVGPGPRAVRHWQFAREAGIKTIAKVQVNCTWEMSVVPSLPTLNLVAQHAENLSRESVNGAMLSWSLGGYPSANIELFQSYKVGRMDENLQALAKKYYGEQATPFIRKAWTQFSEGFKEYPYHLMTVYFGPQQMGPANPFFINPTGMSATMVGIPYDDLKSWIGVFPENIWAGQMEKVAQGFHEGCQTLSLGLRLLKGEDKEKVETELNRARAVEIHCASAANQARFIIERNKYYKSSDNEEKIELIKRMKVITLDELKLVKTMIPIVKKDPFIAYESSNHYYYVPQDLLEKYINLKDVLVWLNNN